MKFARACIVASIGCAFFFALYVARAQEQSASAKSVWDGVYTEDQARRGEPIYSKECAACHGAELTGGESAPPLTGGAFLANWNGLTRQQNADVLAFMLSRNKFPAGKTELYKQSEMLKEIRFESEKPAEKK
jgi:S-disulfanyl-L-cysteine oxidoreductase SoxD